MVRANAKKTLTDRLLLSTFGVLAVAMLLLIMGALLAPRVVSRAVQTYTAPEPLVIAATQIPEPAYEDLRARVDSFGDAIDSGRAHEPLVLTADEVGALIRREIAGGLGTSPDGKPKAELYLRVRDGKLKGPVSILLDDAAHGMFSGLRGRYLNGVATLDLRLYNGTFSVTVESFEIDGEPVAGWILRAVQAAVDQGLAESDELQDLSAKLGGLEIYEDQAVLRSKAR